ncbi:MAG: hypothetical protein WCA63_07390, partial [Gallionella sp.]
ELNIAISKSISGNIYLGASYATGTQPTDTYLGDNNVNSITIGAGYHTPLKENADAMVKGDVILGSVKTGGNSTSENGFDIGAGIRAQLGKKFEGTLAIIHSSTSGGIFASTNTFVNAQLGFNFTTKIQMTADVDFTPDRTSSLKLRYFY